jgi:nucleoside-diphosphate-sugar epimerase
VENVIVKILVLGATGMLGHKLVQELSKDDDVFATVRLSSRPQFETLGIILRNTWNAGSQRTPEDRRAFWRTVKMKLMTILGTRPEII